MRRAYKFRLFTNCSQERALDAMLERHRRLYNLALRERRDVYEAEKRSVSYGEQSARYRESRRVLPGFAALNFSSAQATLRRLDKAFKAFFRRAHSGECPGYPRFKPEGRFRTVEFPSYGDGCRLKENGRLYIQHIGHIKVKLHRAIEGTIKTVSVKRSCGKWYVVFSCALGDAPEPDGDGSEVGIDLGLKSFLVTSDAVSVEPPRSTAMLRRSSGRPNVRSRGNGRALPAAARLATALPSCTRRRPTSAGTFTTKRRGSSSMPTASSPTKLSTSGASPEPGLRSPRTMRVGLSSSISSHRRLRVPLF